MSYRRILWRERSGFEIIVDHVVLGAVIAAIYGAMHPVKHHVIGEIKYAIPANRRIAPGIIGPEVTHEGTIFTAKRTAKRMVPGIERLGKDRILDSDIHRSQLLFLSTCAVVVHMTVHGHIFVRTPGSRY